jgi:hypothetical protein
MDIHDISTQADIFIPRVLTAFRARYPDLLLTALDCECDLETAALHIAVCDAFHDLHLPVTQWPYRNLEEALDQSATPVWVGQYQQRLQLYFKSMLDYSEVQEALFIILQGINSSVRRLQDNNILGGLGFAARPLCRVWSDDEDVMARLRLDTG